MDSKPVSYKHKHYKLFRLLAIISSALTVLFLGLSIFAGVCKPSSANIKSSDGGNIESICLDSNYFYYSTSNNNIIKTDSSYSPVLTLDFDAQVKKEYGIDVNKIHAIDNVNEKYAIVVTQNANDGYVFLLNKTDLSLEKYSTFDGKYARATSNSENYVICSKASSQTAFTRFKINDFAGEHTVGYYYSIKNNNGNYTLNCLNSISSLNLAIKGNDLIVINTGGISVMDLDFTYNNFHTEKAIAQWSNPDYIEKYGIIGTPDPEGTEIVLDGTKFKNNTTYFDCVGNSIAGGFCDVDKNLIYLINSDSSLSSISIKQMKSKRPDRPISESDYIKYDVDFPAHVITRECCSFFSSQNKSAFIIYSSSDLVSRLDISGDSPILQYSANLEFNITNILQHSDKESIIYRYNNENKSGQSGVQLVNAVNIKQFSAFSGLNGAFTAFIIILIIFAILSIILWLSTCKKEFAKKTVVTLKNVAKSKWIYLAILPSIVLLLMFCYYPAIASIGLSFFDYTSENPALNWNNFSHYQWLFTNSEMLNGFKNMALFLVVDIVTAVIPPLLFAFFLSSMKFHRLSAVMRTLLFIPGIIPGIAGNLIWKETILGNYGVINAAIVACGGNIVKFLTTTATAKWALLLVGFPYVGSYLIFYGGMMNIPTSYYEAAELEGLGPWRRFVSIDVPLVLPQIKYVIICSIIASVQNFARVQSITNGAYDTQTPILIMYNLIKDDGNYGRASAVATVIFILLFFATFFTMKQRRKEMKL